MSDELQSAAATLNQVLEQREGAESDPSSQTGTIELDAAAEDVVAPKVEDKPDEKQTEADKFAAKFAALARKDKANREREKALAAKEKQLEERIKQLEEQANKKPDAPVLEPLEKRLRKNPFAALQEEGLDYETLTRAALNDGKLPAEVEMKFMRQEMEQAFQAKFDALKAEMENEKKAKQAEVEEQAKKAKEQQDSEALKNFKGSISEFVKSKVDDYSLVAAEGEDGIEAVFNEIAQDAAAKREEMGEDAEIEILPIEEAVKKVEDRLLNKAKEYIKLQKIQGLFGATAVQGAGNKNQNTTIAKPPQKAGVTLSNSNTQVQAQTKRNLSEEEMLREAARHVKFLAD